MSNIVLKCRQCRKELLDSLTSPLLTSHKLLVTAESIHNPSPDTDCQNVFDLLYLEEVGLPNWILCSVNEAGWKKGKVKCPKCLARLGSFDFVSGRKCNCNKFVLPPVHINKGKVDHQDIEIKKVNIYYN